MSDLEDCVRMAAVLFDDDTVCVTVWHQDSSNLNGGEGFSVQISSDGEEISSSFVKPTAQEAIKALREDLLNRCRAVEKIARAGTVRIVEKQKGDA